MDPRAAVGDDDGRDDRLRRAPRARRADAAARGRCAGGCLQARLASRPCGGRDRRRRIGGRHDPVHRGALHAPRLRDAGRACRRCSRSSRSSARWLCSASGPARATPPTSPWRSRDLAHGRAPPAASGGARPRDDAVRARRGAAVGAGHCLRPLPRARSSLRARGDAQVRLRPPGERDRPARAERAGVRLVARHALDRRARARHRVRCDVPLLLRPPFDAGGGGDDRGARVPRHARSSWGTSSSARR